MYSPFLFPTLGQHPPYLLVLLWALSSLSLVCCSIHGLHQLVPPPPPPLSLLAEVMLCKLVTTPRKRGWLLRNFERLLVMDANVMQIMVFFCFLVCACVDVNFYILCTCCISEVIITIGEGLFYQFNVSYMWVLLLHSSIFSLKKNKNIGLLHSSIPSIIIAIYPTLVHNLSYPSEYIQVFIGL